MEIIKCTENLTPAQIYNMAKANDIRKMSDAEGEVLDVLNFVVYNDTDKDGQIRTVLAVETVEGVRYATNSGTFIRNFMDIRSLHESMNAEPPTRYKVGSGMSKNGRKYYCCDIA